MRWWKWLTGHFSAASMNVYVFKKKTGAGNWVKV